MSISRTFFRCLKQFIHDKSMGFFQRRFFHKIRYIENYAEQITPRENNLDDIITLYKQQQS